MVRQLQGEDAQSHAQFDQTLQGVKQGMQDSKARADHMEAIITGITTQDIQQLQGIVSAITGSDLPTVIGTMGNVTNPIGKIEDEIRGIQM